MSGPSITFTYTSLYFFCIKEKIPNVAHFSLHLMCFIKTQTQKAFSLAVKQSQINIHLIMWLRLTYLVTLWTSLCELFFLNMMQQRINLEQSLLFMP